MTRGFGPDQRRIDANPVLALPAVARLRALPDDQRQLLGSILIDLGADARDRANKSWRQNKGPMAAYWKAVGVYARHLARAIKRPLEGPRA